MESRNRDEIHGKISGYNHADYKNNTELLNEFKIASVLYKINLHKSDWTDHINKIPRNILPWILNIFTSKRQKKSKNHEKTDGQLDAYLCKIHSSIVLPSSHTHSQRSLTCRLKLTKN